MKTIMKSKGYRTWEMNEIQFPRLISEIISVGLTETQWDQLLDTMDLKPGDLAELFDRAQAQWEIMKWKSEF